MNVKTLLFDLDDTLLGNDMDIFLPRYFDLLGEYGRPLFGDSENLLRELLRGTQAMIRNEDRSLSNREVFWRVFAERTGLDQSEAEAYFNRFYDEQFPSLQEVTELRPWAARTVRRALSEGYQVVVATNPLFPLRAIEHRLAWAGLPVEEHDFALVTSYENMHATKPNPAYYEEILEQVGAEPESTLMAGDDWKNDVLPAASLGMHVYWITAGDAEPPEPGVVAGAGTLEQFYTWFFGEPEQGTDRASADD
ncbi:MAG: HAD family hydrolase [Chloroflexi bacterium]|jgi:HAD superfamily hydrolase (TIGR01549 family)|nr:HAD family hydrolase [Chloroflexota bacterium]